MSDVDFIPVACPQCGATIGRMMHEPIREGSNGQSVYRERIFLATTDFNVFDGFTYCRTCGRQFYFKRPSKSWPELVARYRQAQRTAV